MSQLVTDVLGGHRESREVWFLHGILGAGRNWRGFARRLIAERPTWRARLVDLRHHGRSTGQAPPHTVAACVEDLRGLTRTHGEPTVVVGHSFGGKVALAHAAVAPPLRTWSLDAVPGPIDLDDDHDVVQVIRALRGVALPVAGHAELQAWLEARGFSTMLSRWMTTNLERREDGLYWRFDLDAVESMMADYATVDLWPWLRTTEARVTLVRAGRSDRWNAERQLKLQEVEANPAVEVRVMHDAGHWVHVDDPATLQAWLGAVLDELDAR